MSRWIARIADIPYFTKAYPRVTLLTCWEYDFEYTIKVEKLKDRTDVWGNYPGRDTMPFFRFRFCPKDSYTRGFGVRIGTVRFGVTTNQPLDIRAMIGRWLRGLKAVGKAKTR